MPTSRDDAMAQATVRDADGYDGLCAKIENAIADRAGSSLLITVSVVDVPSQIVERAQRSYEQAGWQCSIVRDGRDGDYLWLK